MKKLRLDDYYMMISRIYSEQNARRSSAATFAHFVEVCGLLSVHHRNKKREEGTFMDALCKAFGWYFPLLAKFKVRSVEDLIYRKYPHVCPYCRLPQHDDDHCKTTLGVSVVDKDALREKGRQNSGSRPEDLEGWREMFRTIYRRTVDDVSAKRSILGLFEELGELAEAVRVFDSHPEYFAGEAADVFSYLMGIANEHALELRKTNTTFSLDQELIKRYPGLCAQCGHTVCICPLVPDATVGRMAKELDLEDFEDLFHMDSKKFNEKSSHIASAVLESLGGWTGVIEQFPFDRGDANKSLVLLCLEIADSVQQHNPELANSLRSTAVTIGASATHPGSKRTPAQFHGLIDSIRKIIDKLPSSFQNGSLEQKVGAIMTKLPQ